MKILLGFTGGVDSTYLLHNLLVYYVGCRYALFSINWCIWVLPWHVGKDKCINVELLISLCFGCKQLLACDCNY